ncbi:MAG: deoxycytidine triphosphate deaminase [Gammaproteobacteria bacterium]|nr:deoxycytidine triphosphate deaminase [Gammaproteobacteria bacterium]
MNEGAGMFWSGETLKKRLPILVEPFATERVDCAAYTLAIGAELYVSPSDQSPEPTAVTIRTLTEGEAFTVPPGQFAFLVTQETVTVPDDAIAFMSIRTKVKFRGLVNVSGFHVDPGYRGQLTFAVFNSGPVPIHLKRGQPIFMMWYANLDRHTALKKGGAVEKGLNPEFIAAVAGEVQSFAGVTKKIDTVDKQLSERIHAIERDLGYYRVAAGFAMAVIAVVFATWVQNM